MSGGHFDYIDSRLKENIYGYTDKPTNKFDDMEISQLAWDLLELIRVYDWYISGDSGKEQYLEAKQTFKDKWFSGSRDERLREIIDEKLEEVKKEFEDML